MAGRARARRRLAVRAVLRHRLGTAQARAPEPGAPPDPRGPLRPRPRESGPAAPVRGRRASWSAITRPSSRSTRARTRRSWPPASPIWRPRSGATIRTCSELQSIVAAAARLPDRTDTEPERRAARVRDAAIGQAPAGRARARVARGEGLRRGDALAVQRHPRPAGQLRPARRACWAPRRIASPTGASPATRSTTGGSSTSTTWPPSGWRTPPSSRRLTGSCWPWSREGRITGFRIDHPDGLYTPGALSRRAPSRVRERAFEGAGPAPGRLALLRGGREGADARRGAPRPLARARHHRLRVPQRAERALRRPQGRAGPRADLPAIHGPRPRPFADVVHQAKRLITDTTMASELNVLGRRLARLAERRRESRDFTERSLTEGLREIVACFPVYRSYVGDDGPTASEQDRDHVAQAVSEAQRRSPDHEPVRLRVHRRPAVPDGRARLRAAISADHGARHRQGGRGHRLLPLHPAALPERGRRRARPRRHDARGLPPDERRAAGALAALACSRPPLTTRSEARTSGLGSTCFRSCRRNGASGCAPGIG